MDSISNMSPSELDEHFLRRSFDVARRALANGNHPFGAILVDQNGKVLIEAENGYMPTHDATAHAERLLATQACTTLDPDVVKGATLYSSAEPCAMCAGAHRAGFGRGIQRGTFNDIRVKRRAGLRRQQTFSMRGAVMGRHIAVFGLDQHLAILVDEDGAERMIAVG